MSQPDEGASSAPESGRTVWPTKQPELDLGIPGTGNAEVDGALSGLEGLTNRPVDAHPEVFERVHRELNSAMMDLDDAGPSHTERPVGDQTSP